MTDLFITFAKMSIGGSVIAVLVLLLRLLLKSAPKWITVLLWGFVAIRLVCPISFESSVSLMPDVERISVIETVETGTSEITQPEHVEVSSSADIVYTPTDTATRVEKGITENRLSQVWLVGIIAMLLYTLISFIRVYRQVETAVKLDGNVFQSENISSPFVLGVIKPKIYIPYGLEGKSLEYIIFHEKAHIHRRDHWWKPIGFLILTLHWFNPIIWISYIFLCRDIEFACDEKVVRDMNRDERADYSETLVNCSVRRRMITACPVAFGESGVKNRVKSVLNYKKPAFWVIVIALLVCVATAVFFLTNPIAEKESDSKELIEEIEDRNGYEIISQENVEITLSVHNARLSDAMFTSEGHEFEPHERIAYQDSTTTVYLKHVMVSNESEDKLYFTFDFDYNLPEDGGVYISPMVISDKGYSTHLSIIDKRLYDSETVYDNGVLVRGQGPNDLIVFYIERRALEKLGDYVSFKVGLNKLTYLKDYERRELSEGNLVEDARRVASVTGYNVTDSIVRNCDEGLEVVFESDVYVGVKYKPIGDKWILADVPVSIYNPTDPYVSLADKFPMIRDYAISYASDIGSRIFNEKNPSGKSMTGTLTRLEKLATVTLGETDEAELYYMTYWTADGLVSPGETKDYDLEDRYFAVYVDKREGGEIIRLGHVSGWEFSQEYNNDIMKSRYGNEYNAAAYEMHDKYFDDDVLDEDTILDAYQRATEAAHWFWIGSLSPEVMNGRPVHGVTVGDIDYYKAAKFETYAELKTYLLGLFSLPIVEEFLLSDRYIEYDGLLYTNTAARGADISMGRESYKIKQITETKYELEVKVEVLGGWDDLTVIDYETFIFIYENGVFTTFPSIR